MFKKNLDKIVYLILSTVATLFPILLLYFFKRESFELEIDPEIMNGLLTASSILFGFSSLIVAGHKPIEKSLWYALFIPLILLIVSGSTLYDFVFFHKNSAWAFSVIMAGFEANIVTTMYIVYHKTTMLNIETKDSTFS